MITSLTLLILSLVALYIGAGWLVQGSSALALKAKISPLVVGLTIVAFGTSSPELVVSLNATLSGQGDIAIGNIVGSNIFNIGVILGVSATICPLQVKKQLLRIDIPVMLAATVLFTILFYLLAHLSVTDQCYFHCFLTYIQNNSCKDRIFITFAVHINVLLTWNIFSTTCGNINYFL